LNTRALPAGSGQPYAHTVWGRDVYAARAVTITPKGQRIFRKQFGVSLDRGLATQILVGSDQERPGGASFYTWAAMPYTIGSIVGGASTGMVWSRLGARRAYTLGAGHGRSL
jgi:hypothetical protein